MTVFSPLVELLGSPLRSVFHLEDGGSSAAPPIIFPLDLVTAQPLMAFSVRRLRTAYTGPLMRVERSSDNTQQDIGATPTGFLDVAALTAFCGAGSGKVATMYDQSGNGHHTVPSPAVFMPSVYVAGAVSTRNGVPVLRQTGTPQNIFFRREPMLGHAAATFLQVENQGSFVNTFAWAADSFNNGGLSGHWPFSGSNYYSGFMSAVRVNVIGPTSLENSFNIRGAAQSGTALHFYWNGVEIGVYPVPYQDPQPGGGGMLTTYNGGNNQQVGESLLFASKIPDADRRIIEASQSAYFSIPVV